MKEITPAILVRRGKKDVMKVALEYMRANPNG